MDPTWTAVVQTEGVAEGKAEGAAAPWHASSTATAAAVDADGTEKKNAPPAPSATVVAAATAAAAAQDAVAAAAAEFRRAELAQQRAANTHQRPGSPSIASRKAKQKSDRWKRYGGDEVERLLETVDLVDARYLVALAQAGGVLPRAQELPASAKITPATCWRLQGWPELFSTPVLVLSYPWLDRSHPDRHGVLLRAVAPILRGMIAAAEAKGECMHGTVGVMMDWCSLPQVPRSAADQARFDAGLEGMSLWYSHPFTHVLLVTTPLPEGGDYSNCRPYYERGWCFSELKTSSLVKNADLLWDLSKLPPVAAAVDADDSADGAAVQTVRTYMECRMGMVAGRQPPLSPDAVAKEMRARVSAGTLAFTYEADIEPVIEMYRKGFVAAFAGYRQLRQIKEGAGTTIYYGQLGWTDADAAVMADAIRYADQHCDMRGGKIELQFTDNRLTSKGVDMLRAAAGQAPGPAPVADRGAPLNFVITGTTKQFPPYADEARRVIKPSKLKYWLG